MDTKDKLKWLGTQIPVASSLKLKSHADELNPLSAEFFLPKMIFYNLSLNNSVSLTFYFIPKQCI